MVEEHLGAIVAFINNLLSFFVIKLINEQSRKYFLLLLVSFIISNDTKL